jgi:hypothetical protein
VGEGPGALVHTVPLVCLREVYTAPHRRAGATIGILRHPLIAGDCTGCLANWPNSGHVTGLTSRARRSLIEMAVSRGVERYFLKQLWDRDVSQVTSQMARTMLSHIVAVAHRLDHRLGTLCLP